MKIANEILYQIFLYLPIKVLLKFKCISKEWNLIIEEREFVYSFMLRSRSRIRLKEQLRCIKLKIEPTKIGSPILLVVNSNGKSESTGIELNQCRWLSQFKKVSQFPFAEKWKQSILGLTCLGDIILNLNTKEAIKLPDHEDCWKNIQEPLRTPQNGWICYSLGFDATSKSYKALILFSDSKEHVKGPLLQARVLTLGIDSSWRNVNVNIPCEWADLYHRYSIIMIRASVFVDNKIFFLISDLNPRLIAFDVQHEKFHFLSPPDYINMPIHMIELKGRLALLFGSNVDDVGILKDYKNQEWITGKVSSPSKRSNNSSTSFERDDHFLIYEDVETILPLKQIKTIDKQHIWRWGCQDHI